MSYQIINELVERFSCDLVRADFKDPKTLSGLLPILKQIHTQCMALSLKSEAKDIIQARNLINECIKNNPENVTEHVCLYCLTQFLY